MNAFQVAYIPIGVPTFHQESALTAFHESIETLSALTTDLKAPDGPLLSLDDLKTFLSDIRPDLVILQNTTFANSAYANEVMKSIDCPVLLWTLREPVIDGTRLRLNSLTGAYSAGNLMHHVGKGNFEYIYGSPKDGSVIDALRTNIEAGKLKHTLKSITIASIGGTPQGFGFGQGLDAEVTRVFGANLESIEARELMTKAGSYSDEDIQAYLAEAKGK